MREDPGRLILALDTSGSVLGTALASWSSSRGGEVVWLREQPDAVRHVENLPGAIDRLLVEAGRGREELTALAIGRGPGSFTGLRVGMASAKAVSLALGVPLVGVDCLEAFVRCERPELTLAEHAETNAGLSGNPEELVVVAMDARKQRYYAALFGAGAGQLWRLTPDQDLRPEELAAIVSPWQAEARIRVIVTGPAAAALAPVLHAEPGSHTGGSCVAGVALSAPDLVHRGVLLGEYDGPFYLRESDIGRRSHQPRFRPDET